MRFSSGFTGVAALVLTCTIWGTSGVFFKAVAGVPPLEVIAHRTIWSLVFFALVLALQGRMGDWRALLTDRAQLPFIVIAAVMIAVNWCLFVLSIQIGRAVESGLGYYIFPLFAVFLGWLALGEKLSPLKWAAVALAGVGVSTLIIGLGVWPLIAFGLAISMGFYGLAKRRVQAGAVLSVASEVVILTPIALVYLFLAHAPGWGFGEIGPGFIYDVRPGQVAGGFGRDLGLSALLIFAGPLTSVPLILFSFGGKRVTYATQGLVLYINPTLQTLVAVLIFGEAFTIWHGIAFGLIWVGLGLYSLSAFNSARASNITRKASTSATTST